MLTSRQRLFLYQDGFITSLILGAFRQRDVFDLFLAEPRVSVDEIVHKTSANAGYLHVALRCLAQQGLLSRVGIPGTSDLIYSLTERGHQLTQVLPHYERIADFLCSHAPLDRSLLGADSRGHVPFGRLVDLAAAKWQLPASIAPAFCEHIQHHLNGALILVLMIGLWNTGTLDGDRLEGALDGLTQARRFLQLLGWIDAESRWTEAGKAERKYALHYGMVGSYLPMLTQLPAMLFHSTEHRTHLSPGHLEAHVDRRLNVLASGAAHRRYFEDADAIFVDLFNREPLAEQPAFVADMGCGDGSWLKHTYEIIKSSTRRGSQLDKHPLLMVGIDYNEAALAIARETLHVASIPSLVLWGDVTDPDRLAADLARQGIDIAHGVHIRSFIDHNRQYTRPVRTRFIERRDLSTGAYVDETGAVIPNLQLEQDLVHFLQRWVPHVKRHGLILLEAHCVDPRVAARHVGDLHNIVFDTYHGLSKQYPVDFEVFMRSAEAAGLEPSIYHQKRYPSRKPFVSISINRFIVPRSELAAPALAPIERQRQWRPLGNENLQDGEALHQLLYDFGDTCNPRSWCSNGTGILLNYALRFLNERLDQIRAGKKPPRITIMDYGTGTGLVATELLKAINETGILKQLEELRVELVIYLLDIPSGWFAKGHELLNDCPYVRFHSLTDANTGAFLPLRDVLGADVRIDLAIASMVFHLIPRRALPKLFESLASVLVEDGRLLWNSPDLGPSLPDSALFHAPNRLLRQIVLELLAEPAKLLPILASISQEKREKYRHLPAELIAAAAELTPASRAAAELVANQQILSDATPVEVVAQELRRHFRGEIFFKTFEMRMRDSIDAILVPSNQRYLSEIANPSTRRHLTTLLMMSQVMPQICNGQAGTTFGFNLHWSFGDFGLASMPGPSGVNPGVTPR